MILNDFAEDTFNTTRLTRATTLWHIRWNSLLGNKEMLEGVESQRHSLIIMILTETYDGLTSVSSNEWAVYPVTAPGNQISGRETERM